MTCESEAANVWAALLGLAFFIAVTITAGWWFCIDHQEAVELQQHLAEPYTTINMIWDDLPSWPVT